MDRNERTSPLAAGLIGGLVASIFTLTAVYVANQENRRRIMIKLDELKKSMGDKTLDARRGTSQQLRALADSIETEEKKTTRKSK
jgi:hypothetical protein